MNLLSVVIITRNEAKRINDCISSVTFADEILVVDSGSEDQTVELAKKAGALVIQEPWRGFGPQKQFAVDNAKYDWVLCLDSDEQVSEALRASIIAVLKQAKHSAYEMPRCNRFLGRRLRHGEGYPDYSLRLFNRKKARWSDDKVHEKVVVDDTIDVDRLQGDLMHHSEDGIAEYLAKQDHYTSLQAVNLYERGKRFSVPQMLFSPVVRFIKFYFFRLGILDGVPGLIHILIGCMNSFFKYAKLYELHRQKSD